MAVHLPRRLGVFRHELARFQHRFSLSTTDALDALAHVFDLSLAASGADAPNGETVTIESGEVVITCEMCCDPSWESWWQANFGSWWREARWWFCGPFGQECNCPATPEPEPDPSP